MSSARYGMPLLIISMALYCVIGFTGFDPMRQDEAYIFGIILEYWRGHSWIVPLLAGQPHMEKPPLYYLLGAASARLFSPWLPLHDAARLCSAFLIAITVLCIACCGRLTWGAGYGRFAALALLCSLGLFVPTHMLLTDNAQLTGCAIALLGFAGAVQQKWWSGFTLGTGAGIAFLAKGLLGPGVIGLTALVLFMWPHWRSRSYLLALAVALIAALPWILIWPIALYRTSSLLFSEWLATNNFARYLGYAPHCLNAVKDKKFWYTTFLWATFPVLPLAFVSLHRYRATFSAQPALSIGTTFALALSMVLVASATLRAIYALPLLLAFALIAAPVLRNPPSWMGESTLVSQMLFAVLGLFIWIYWLTALVMKINLSPLLSATLGTLDDRHGRINIFAAVVAGVVTVFWVLCQKAWRNQHWRGPAAWYSSVFCSLALFSLLCLPSLSEQGSYRSLYRQMSAYLPSQGCINSIGLGESQRGMLDYVLNIKTQAIDNARNSWCNTLLIDSSVTKPEPKLSDDWHLLWSGARSKDAHEIFYLYTRDNHSTDAALLGGDVGVEQRHAIAF
jgi:4-amino-4-deoxy-L-arabinose transferase-like glycosyltransferase